MGKLKEIEDRLKAATPGPWEATQDVVFVEQRALIAENCKDAEFVANAPTDIAYLLDRVRKLEGVLRDIESNYDCDINSPRELGRHLIYCRACKAKQALEGDGDEG